MNSVQKKHLLKKWSTRISQAKTNRAKLKNELLSLVTVDESDNIDEKYEKFIRKHEQLLSNDHGQGFAWESHFQGLWNWVASFLPASWRNPFSGSKLREALDFEFELPKFPPMTEDRLPSENEAAIVDKKTAGATMEMEPEEPQNRQQNPSEHQALMPREAFEHKLIFEPADALRNLYINLHSPATVEEQFSEILAQLILIRHEVDALVYYRLLETLYQHQPAKTVDYFYKDYQKDTRSVPDAHDFIEQHLLVKTLLNQFVRSGNDIHNRIHNVHYLLIFFNFPQLESHPSPIKTDFFMDLITAWSNNREDDIANLLPSLYREKSKDLYSIVNKLLTIDEQRTRNAMAKFNSTTLKSSGDNSNGALKMMIDMYEHRSLPSHPLLNHFARQACEQLLIDFRKNPNEDMWREGHEGYVTIQLLCQKILSGKMNSLKFTEHQAIIPTAHDTSVLPNQPFDFKTAESYALQVVLGAALSPEAAVDAARQIRKTSLYHPTSEIVSWIMKRVSYIHDQNTNNAMISTLRHTLQATDFYSIDNLPSNEPLPPSEDPDSLITQLNTAWDKACDARNRYQAIIENQSTASVLSLFFQLLHHPQLNSNHLQQIAPLLQAFSQYYLAAKLNHEWNKTMDVIQTQLCRWNPSKLEAQKPVVSDNPSLKQVRDLSDKALTAGLSIPKQYADEFNYSGQAVYLFTLVFQQINQEDKDSLTQAKRVLEEIERYVSDDLYATLTTAINRLQKSPVQSKSSDMPFFSPSPNLPAPSNQPGNHPKNS